MAKNTGITREEWLQALNEVAVPESDPSALTLGELVVLLGMSESATKRRVKRLLLDKKITRLVKRVRRVDGSVVSVSAYKLL